MKSIIVVISALISGCANFNPVAFEQALQTMKQAQQDRERRDNELNRSLRGQSAPAAPGMMGFLQDQSVNGTLRYCRYSNGIVNTISSMSLCPLSIQ